jgi:hypothetical protein
VFAHKLMSRRGASLYAPSRLITAFPNGNTGALVYFIPLNTTSTPTPLGTTLDFPSLTSYSSTNNQTGIRGNFSVSSDLAFGVTISESLASGEGADRCSRIGEDAA